jgi:hypothetical protein
MKKMIFSTLAFALLFGFKNSFSMDHKKAKKQLRKLQRLYREDQFDAKAAKQAMKLERETAKSFPQISIDARSLHKKTDQR